MLRLVDSIRFVWFVREECIFSNGEVGMFPIVGPCRPCIPCNSQDDFHHRGHIGHHLIFLFGGIGLSSGHLRICLISVWDVNNFLCAHIILLIVGLGGSNLILHCCILVYSTLNMSLLFRAGFSSTKNMEIGSLVLYCLIFQIFVTVWPSFSISVLISWTWHRNYSTSLPESIHKPVILLLLRWLHSADIIRIAIKI
jgi:hypothetical protein